MYLKNLLTTIYYSNSNNKKAIIIKNNKVYKVVKLHKQTLLSVYKQLYKNNFKKVTYKQLNSLNKSYLIKSYLNSYKTIYATAFMQKITI